MNRSGLFVVSLAAIACAGGRIQAQFELVTTLPTAFPTTAARVVDVVGGNGADVLTGAATATGSMIRLFENLGLPNLNLVAGVPIGGTVSDVDAADLDADGDIDIVAALLPTNGSASHVVLINNAATFTAAVFLFGAQASGKLFLVDIDRDGDIDIVRGNQQHLNNGAAVFLPGATLPGSNIAGAAIPSLPVDFNLDGAVDLAFLQTTAIGGDAVIALNDGVGAFPTTIVLANFAPAGVVGSLQAADVDADGFPDIVMNALGGPAGLRIALSVLGSALAVQPAVPFAGGAFNTALAGPLKIVDFDGDGRVDFLAPVVDPNGLRTLHVLRGAANGALIPVPGFTPAFSPAGSTGVVATGDLDADGDDDLLLQPNAGASSIDLLRSTGAFFVGTLVSLGGGEQATSVDVAFPNLLEVLALDDGGAPRVGLVLEASTTSTAVEFPVGTLTVTDGGGIARLPVRGGSVSGPSVISIAPAGASQPASTFSIFTRALSTAVTAVPGGNVATIDYFHERMGVPLLVAADSVPYQLGFGVDTIATSILAPSSGLVVLDGLGLFGPPNPTVVTSPTFSFSAFVPVGVLGGVTFTVQAYGLDFAYPTFPDYVVISNPAPLIF